MDIGKNYKFFSEIIENIELENFTIQDAKNSFSKIQFQQDNAGVENFFKRKVGKN